MALAPAWLQAQSFDTSGTASLSGKYLFRYVNYFNDENGDLTESCSLSGAMTFDGAGHYTLSNTQLFDSGGSSGRARAVRWAGERTECNPTASHNWTIRLYLRQLFSAPSASRWSSPVPRRMTSSISSSRFKPVGFIFEQPAFGQLHGGYLDFLNASASLARQGYFTLKADGQGNIAAFTVTGSLENVNSGATVTQSVAASTYTLSGTAGGTMTFPGSSATKTQIVGGAKVLYVSADGNWLVGGSATGSDMFFGFRAPSGTSSNSLLNGTYFTAGMEDYVASPPDFLDAFYGSINTNGNGNLISHQRIDDVVDVIHQ